MRHTTRNLSLLSLGLSVSALVGWLLFREHRRNQSPQDATGHTLSDTASLEIPQIVLPMSSITNDEVVISSRSSASTNALNDDLTRIRGIGPKFAQALNTIGITHFSQLAEETPNKLASKLTPYVSVRAQRIRDNDWIGQAGHLANLDS